MGLFENLEPSREALIIEVMGAMRISRHSRTTKGGLRKHDFLA